jgi:transposase
MCGRCSQCQKPAPRYDRLAERSWLFVPLWGIPTHFRYAPRRVECPEHGVVVEQIPWSASALARSYPRLLVRSDPPY